MPYRTFKTDGYGTGHGANFTFIEDVLLKTGEKPSGEYVQCIRKNQWVSMVKLYKPKDQVYPVKS